VRQRVAVCRHHPRAPSTPTLQCAPSESTNCASTPPKSCFLGGMLKARPWPGVQASALLSQAIASALLSNSRSEARTVTRGEAHPRTGSQSAPWRVDVRVASDVPPFGPPAKAWVNFTPQTAPSVAAQRKVHDHRDREHGNSVLPKTRPQGCRDRTHSL
jgi:hypothetical protein